MTNTFLRSISYTEIQNVDAGEWDSLIGAGDPFHTYSFLKGLEAARVEDSRLYLVMFYRETELVGSAVLSDFSISLDLFIGSHPMVQKIKSWRPHFFEVRLLFCGTPISSGHRNLYVKRKEDYPAVLTKLNEVMEGICREEGIRFTTCKEFFDEEMSLLRPTLEPLGWFSGYSLPYLKLPIRWKSFEEYLGALRSPFRRQIKRSLKKLGVEKPVFAEAYFEGEQKEEAPVFAFLRPIDCPPGQFYHLYMSVMARAEVKLETLNQAFFEHFYEQMADNMKLLGMVYQGEVLSVAVLLDQGSELSFIWTGKPGERDDQFDNYFNLLTAMLVYAIEEGYDSLLLGQTAYYTKQRMGGETHELQLFFKSHSWFWQPVLKALRKVVFPRLELRGMEVFRA